MTWDDSQMWGKMEDIKEALDEIRATLDKDVVKGGWRKKCNLSSSSYQESVLRIRKFVEWLNSKGYCSCTEAKDLRKYIKDRVNWSAHDEDDTSFNTHYPITPENQQEMVDALRELVEVCGVVADTESEDSEDSDYGFGGLSMGGGGGEVCNFYLQRRCKYGARGYGCSNLHPCRFYLNGHCNKGSSCDWPHV